MSRWNAFMGHDKSHEYSSGSIAANPSMAWHGMAEDVFVSTRFDTRPFCLKWNDVAGYLLALCTLLWSGNDYLIEMRLTHSVFLVFIKSNKAA